MKSRNRLILLLAVISLTLALFSSCSKKRCNCLTTRVGYQTARSIEDLGGHSNCSELDAEWIANDSTSELLNKTCTPAD